MSDHEHARLMLRMAEKDHTALQGMLDTQIFADEIFGFHAQQAAEKALKAWLSLIGVDYPRIHDLEELLALLAQRGATVSERFYGLIDFTDFAVQFRYATVEEEDEPLDRLAMIQQVTELMDHVEQLLVDTDEDIEQ